MNRTGPRVAHGLAGLVACTLAAAGPSTSAIGDHLGLFLESSVQQYQMLCSAREPASAAAWRAQVAPWRDRNAQPLQELRRITGELQAVGRQRAFEAPASEPLDKRADLLVMYSGFMLLAASQPAMLLARANDAQASVMCRNWLDALAAGGELDRQPALAVEGGKRLLAALAAAPK
jgi:hypothetical protein